METDVDWSARAMLDAVRYEFTHDRQQGAPASSRKARAKLSDDGPAGTARSIERCCQLQVEVSFHVLPPTFPFHTGTRAPREPIRRSDSRPTSTESATPHYCFGREAIALLCMESSTPGRDTGRAMSQANVELVRAMNEAFEQGDIEGALAKLHPEVEWHGTKGGLDDGKIARGHREVIAGFVEAFEAWERQSLETTDYFDAGDRVLVFFHEVAKGRESGAVVETDTGVIFTVKDGSVVRVDPFMDRDEALEAAGLSE